MKNTLRNTFNILLVTSFVIFIFLFINIKLIFGSEITQSQKNNGEVLQAATTEQRAVWLQDDVNLSQDLDMLKQAHFNAVYFGVWGANNMTLQEIIDLVHSKGLDFHMWEANAYICAGQWIGTCTNDDNRPEWFSRLPNGMTRGDIMNSSEFFDFGVPEARDYSINVMLDYLNNYNVEGIHFDYIRYDGQSNYSFTDVNINQFTQQYGIDGNLIKGEKFPAFAYMKGNRVATPTTAQVLGYFHDGVPAILVNNYRNGEVLTINWHAYNIYIAVVDDVLQSAINQYGTANIYVVRTDVNPTTYDKTTTWLNHLDFSYSQTTLDNISQLPTGSLVIIPGVYSFTNVQISALDNHLAQAGNVIFIDGPTTTIRNDVGVFRDIVGASSVAPYLKEDTIITVPSEMQNHPFLVGLINSEEITYEQAIEHIGNWREYMQGTVTAVVRGVSEQAKQIKPDVYISAAIFPAEEGSNIKVHQNWPLWLNEGYLDYAFTMGYALDMDTFNTRINWLETNGFVNNSLPGLDAFRFTSCNDTNTVIQQIEALRDLGFRGFNIFQSRDMTNSGYVAADCNILSDLETFFGQDVDPYYPPQQIPPSTYDLNQDGSVDYTDVKILLQAWFNQSGNEDFNTDGMVNSIDYQMLINEI